MENPGWLANAPPGVVEEYKYQLVNWVRFLKKTAAQVSLGKAKRNIRLIRIARREIARTVEAFNNRDALPKTACRQGCAFCCHYKVDVSAPEADRITSLVERWPEERRAGLINRLRAGKAAENSDSDPVTYRHPCPFLEGAECTIYDERPLSCRSYVSPTVRICELAVSKAWIGPPEISVKDLQDYTAWLVLLNPITDAAFSFLGAAEPLATAVLERLEPTISSENNSYRR